MFNWLKNETEQPKKKERPDYICKKCYRYKLLVTLINGKVIELDTEKYYINIDMYIKSIYKDEYVMINKVYYNTSNIESIKVISTLDELLYCNKQIEFFENIMLPYNNGETREVLKEKYLEWLNQV